MAQMATHLLRWKMASCGLKLTGGSVIAGLPLRRVAPVCTRVLAISPSMTKPSLLHTSCKAFDSPRANQAIVNDDSNAEGDGPWMADLKKRGLYSEDRYGHYHQYKINTLCISQDKKKLTVDWNDGHTSTFDAIWLRHVCHCGDCKHDVNGMVKIEWPSLPVDITIVSATLEGDKMMVFEWATPDGTILHQGSVPTATLRCHCYSDAAIRDRRQRRAMTFHDEKTVPEIECEEFFASEKGVHRCLTEVNDRGICLVKNVPPNIESFKKTLAQIGPIQSTMYGETFEVVATPNPINAAYSSAKLPLHMDLTFYEAAPGLQILHCWRFDKDIVGGSSTFLDIHEVAHKFRREYPEFFDRLTRLPAVFQSIHYNRPRPVHMENQKPIFALNHFGELVSVTWHPKVPGPIELPQDDMVPFYEAYTAFYKMVSEHKSLYKSQFKEGDFMIFNNRRVLHGREAFSSSSQGGRHLTGGYIELSDFHSRTQALHNKHGDSRLATRSGSHSWF